MIQKLKVILLHLAASNVSPSFFMFPFVFQPVSAGDSIPSSVLSTLLSALLFTCLNHCNSLFYSPLYFLLAVTKKY